MLTTRTLLGAMPAQTSALRPLGALSDIARGLSTPPENDQPYETYSALRDSTNAALTATDLSAMPIGQRMTAALDLRLIITHLRTLGERANTGSCNLLEDRLVDALRDIDPLANAPDHDPVLLSREDIQLGNPAHDPRPVAVVLGNITALPIARMDLLRNSGLEALLTPAALKRKA